MARVVRDSEGQAAAPLRPVRLGRLDPVIEGVRTAPSISGRAQAWPYHDTLSQPLEHWAEAAPERLFLAQRDTHGEWRKLTYSQVLSDVRRIAQYCCSRAFCRKPIVVLSGNDIEHALLALAAMYVGIPYAPISPPIR